ncbi:MAG: hypothetical protein OXL68_15340 [Paracoccaceae bacterium]|nr:hypothetical protein [Paracoccaceae bacterium]
MLDNAAAARMRNAFDVIEEAYEFMLAYAAQGRKSEESKSSGPSQIRQFLIRFRSATQDLADVLESLQSDDGGVEFHKRWLNDTRSIQSVVDLLLAQSSISSEMIDNTNGLIVMRSFLTDIFFADHVMLPGR